MPREFVMELRGGTGTDALDAYIHINKKKLQQAYVDWYLNWASSKGNRLLRTFFSVLYITKGGLMTRSKVNNRERSRWDRGRAVIAKFREMEGSRTERRGRSIE